MRRFGFVFIRFFFGLNLNFKFYVFYGKKGFEKFCFEFILCFCLVDRLVIDGYGRDGRYRYELLMWFFLIWVYFIFREILSL